MRTPIGLVVCGDVADSPTDVEWPLGLLRERFSTVIWAPGNHEPLTHRDDASGLRGVRRYRRLVGICRRLGVITPEDSYPVGKDGEARRGSRRFSSSTTTRLGGPRPLDEGGGARDGV
jgi:3',5'-cyclic AMP phosphodiesterase CpdA